MSFFGKTRCRPNETEPYWPAELNTAYIRAHIHKTPEIVKRTGGAGIG